MVQNQILATKLIGRTKKLLKLHIFQLQPRLCLLHRDEVETDMQFLGLLMMKNLVKPQTAGVINTLRLAALRTIMVTGERQSNTGAAQFTDQKLLV